ncbi:MAG: sigma 54-interacting transcriptional regulator [Deltaproteobacteria bacterium]|nr:sigma 54-interacting transcriptional regulator [Deltaproteobacteria bacterium]
MIRIEFIAGPRKGEQVEMDREAVTFGRRASCDIAIDNPYVSGEHGQLYRSGEKLYFSDLDSTNGTVLTRDGRDRLFRSERLEILPGDILTLGGVQSDMSFRASVLLPETGGADPGDDTRTVLSVRKAEDRATVDGRIGRDTAALAQVYRLWRKLEQVRRPEEAWEAVADAAVAAFEKASRVTILVKNRRKRFEAAVSRTQSGAAPQEPFILSRSLLEQMAARRECLLVEDVPARFPTAGSVAASKILSCLCAPVMSQGEFRAIIQIDNKTEARAFDERDLDLLLVISGVTSRVVENLELVEELRKKADRLAEENTYWRSQFGRSLGDIVGGSVPMQAVFEKLRKVIGTDTTVLIEGETGTGKELVARAIHYGGPRAAQGEFRAVNCAALAETLLESELFGHVKGAFTGAMNDKKGLFEICDGGTLFLDEVGDMPAAMQVKLLRVLQEGEFSPVGATETRKADVRIVSASNKNLETEVKAGRFREDLFYRLSVFPVRVPPLRERGEDAALLAAHFLRKLAREGGRPAPVLSEAARQAILAYGWPGNVRELENEMQRAVINLDGGTEVGPEHLSERVTDGGPGGEGDADRGNGTLKALLEQREREILQETLLATGGNRTRAAELLGFSRQGFMKKIARYGIR